MRLKTGKSNETYFCPLCDSSSSDPVSYGHVYILCKCGECGMIFKDMGSTSRRKIQKIQDNIYTEQYIQSIHHNKKQFQKFAKDRVVILLKYKKKGRLLEIGCAAGHFLDLAGKAGFEATGIDASSVFSEEGLKKGLDIKCGRVEDFELPKSYFDVIAMFHLIEHIEKLKPFLTHLRELLKEDGVLLIITPNAEAFTDRVFGWKHPKYNIKDHIYCFSHQTLRSLLVGQGFEVIDILSKEYRHQFGTSLIGFVKPYVKSLMADKMLDNKTVVETSTASQKKRDRSRIRSLARYVLWKIPYIVGDLLYPVLKPYGSILEKRIKGGELIVISKKAGKKG